MKLCGLFVLILIWRICECLSKVKIENNQYKGMVVAIHPSITENQNVINALKVIFKKTNFQIKVHQNFCAKETSGSFCFSGDSNRSIAQFVCSDEEQGLFQRNHYSCTKDLDERRLQQFW